MLGQSVAGVKPGNSTAEVRAVSRPAEGHLKSNGVTNWFFEHEGRNAKPVDWLTLAHHRVVGIETTTKSQRTKRGIGPGDSLKARRRPTRT